MATCATAATAFVSAPFTPRTTATPVAPMAATTAAASTAELFDPAAREAHFGDDMARYLVTLHDSSATFDFCGGMMFQLVLSSKLRAHLGKVAESAEMLAQQPVLFDATMPRMAMTPGYSQCDAADNVKVFHGREIRTVPSAAGGMGMVLQLSMAGSDDPEGWSPQEVAEYNGWAHDSQRKWRKGQDYEGEGFEGFRERFGPQAFGLHHRFYLHRDAADRLWLSAEDGCEGTPAPAKRSFVDQVLGR